MWRSTEPRQPRTGLPGIAFTETADAVNFGTVATGFHNNYRHFVPALSVRSAPRAAIAFHQEIVNLRVTTGGGPTLKALQL
jgi:hypothetical protein